MAKHDDPWGGDEFYLDGDVATVPPAAVTEGNGDADWPAETTSAPPPPAATAPATVPSRRPSPAAQPAGRRAVEPLYFDLETVPDEKRMHLFDLEPLPEYQEATAADCPAIETLLGCSLDGIKESLAAVTPPADWLDQLHAAETAGKKPRKGVFDLIAEKRGAKQAVEDAREERIKLLSVTPEYCSIAALGWAVGDKEPQSIVAGDVYTDDGEVADETVILETLWKLVKVHAPVIGFNILGFDLPVVFVRSYLLGIPSTKLLDLKPWGKDVCDVMFARFPKGGGKKLKTLAKLMGIEVPAGDTDGGNVYPLMQAGEFAKVHEYVRSDIVVTRGYHATMKGFWF